MNFYEFNSIINILINCKNARRLSLGRQMQQQANKNRINLRSRLCCACANRRTSTLHIWIAFLPKIFFFSLLLIKKIVWRKKKKEIQLFGFIQHTHLVGSCFHLNSNASKSDSLTWLGWAENKFYYGAKTGMKNVGGSIAAHWMNPESFFSFFNVSISLDYSHKRGELVHYI